MILKRDTSVLALIIVCIASTCSGCVSIRSDAVRSLIDKQSEKIEEAKKNSQAFVSQTDSRVAAYQNGVKDLNDSLIHLRRQESVYALVFSSNQNVATKRSIDALAVTYQAGVLYMATDGGLQQAVLDQFNADFLALGDLSKKVAASWASLGELQSQVNAYSKQSGIASVDPAFVTALLKQTRTNTDQLDNVIQQSKTLNETLKAAARLKPLKGKVLESTETYTSDLLNLLEAVKQ